MPGGGRPRQAAPADEPRPEPAAPPAAAVFVTAVFVTAVFVTAVFVADVLGAPVPPAELRLEPAEPPDPAAPAADERRAPVPADEPFAVAGRGVAATVVTGAAGRDERVPGFVAAAPVRESPVRAAVVDLAGVAVARGRTAAAREVGAVPPASRPGTTPALLGKPATSPLSATGTASSGPTAVCDRPITTIPM